MLLVAQLLLATCELWCANAKCSELNGDVQYECGGCGQHATCRPGVADYTRAVVGGTGQVAQPDSMVGSLAEATSVAPARTPPNVTAVSCRRLAADDLKRMSPRERAAALDQPTIITGLIDTWPSTVWLRSSFGFDSVDPTKLDRQARASRQAAADALLRRLNSEYATPEPLLRASAQRVLSYMMGQGGVHITPNHGFAWLGLVNGSKRWYLAPPTLPVPDEFGCTHAHGMRCASDAWAECMARAAGCTHVCEQSTWEVIVVPTAWWHATCNEHGDDGTVGIGGQDACDTAHAGTCDLQMPTSARLLNKQGVHSVCPDAELGLACHDQYGVDLARSSAPRLLQPDLQVFPKDVTGT